MGLRLVLHILLTALLLITMFPHLLHMALLHHPVLARSLVDTGKKDIVKWVKLVDFLMLVQEAKGRLLLQLEV